MGFKLEVVATDDEILDAEKVLCPIKFALSIKLCQSKVKNAEGQGATAKLELAVNILFFHYYIACTFQAL